MERWEEVPLARRAWVRLALWGAAGPSLVVGEGCPMTCHKRADPLPPRGSSRRARLAQWAELGRLWRRMSEHRRNGGKEQGWKASFDIYKLRADETLGLLGASPELRLAFEARYEHLDRLLYSTVTCYEMAAPAPGYDAVVDMEKRVEVLEDLVTKGTLTEGAARAAARALSVDLEVLLQDSGPDLGSPDEHAPRASLDAAYRAGKITPRPGAQQAGERLAELTVDRLELLSPLPKEPPEEPPGTLPGG